MEWLRQIVVSAHFQTDDTVDRLAPSGQDDNADLGPAIAQLTRELQAVLAAEHQIEDHDIDSRARHLIAQTGAILRDRHAKSLLAQVPLDEVTNILLVIHN